MPPGPQLVVGVHGGAGKGGAVWGQVYKLLLDAEFNIVRTAVYSQTKKQTKKQVSSLYGHIHDNYPYLPGKITNWTSGQRGRREHESFLFLPPPPQLLLLLSWFFLSPPSPLAPAAFPSGFTRSSPCLFPNVLGPRLLHSHRVDE